MIEVDIFKSDISVDHRAWQKKTQEWFNFEEYVVTEGLYFDNYLDYTSAINDKLEPYNAKYNHLTCKIQFQTEEDYLLFKLRWE